MARLATRQRQGRYDAYLHAVDRLKGPAPTCPFRVLRLENNLTLAELCEVTGISKQAAIRLEQGTFTEPIDRVLNYWISEHGESYPDLVNRYEHYQAIMRLRHARIFGPMPMLTEFHRHLDKHPFVTLRGLWQNPETGESLGQMNVTECSKLLCIPQSVLDYFDNKIVRQASVPKPLMTALKQNKYRTEELMVFEEAYRDFRQFFINGVTPEETKAALSTVTTNSTNDWRAELLKSVTHGG